MWALIVAIALMLNGAILEDKMTYTGATWTTEQECKTFVESEAGKTSLAGLHAYLVNASDDGNVQMIPVCTKIEEGK